MCAAILVVFFTSYFVIVQPAYTPNGNEINGAYTIEDENSFIIFDGESYHMYVDNVYFEDIDEAELDNAPYNRLPIYGG